MLNKRGFFFYSCLVFILALFSCRDVLACGHDGFYAGLGYNQLFMYTPQRQISLGDIGRITIGPGFGGNAVIGYDFCGSRWGIQMPFEFSRQKLNGFEWVNQFGSSIEGVLHLVEWANGIDVHMIMGGGWSYLTEGGTINNSAASGIMAQAGPGITWYFLSNKRVSGGLVFEVPIRMIHYFGRHLSSNSTTLLAIPLRLSVQFGF